MEYIALAIVVVAGLAWDIARRALKPVPVRRIEQVEAAQQALASDMHKTDKMVEELAFDWLKKFTQLEAAQADKTKTLESKVATTVATMVPNRGYNR